MREQLERLAEISPQIPESIISQFNDKFHDQKNVSKPEITNGLDPIRVFVEDSECFTPNDGKPPITVKVVDIPEIGRPTIITSSSSTKISTLDRTPGK
jgi:hypothetical protein